ncbi:unnamed protein product [Leuciscus chuanchicus]
MEDLLAAMIASAMEKQQQFIEAQFKTLQDRLDNIQSELSSCSNRVRELCDRYSSLNSRVGKLEKNYDKSVARLMTLEEKMSGRETGEETFELHALQSELEAVGKQIHDLLVRQAELIDQRLALETSRADAHKSVINVTNPLTLTSSTPCVSQHRS